MTLDLSNAYQNAFNLKTCSGLDIPSEFSTWYEVYRDHFLGVLEKINPDTQDINKIILNVYLDTLQYSHNNKLTRGCPIDFGSEEIDEESRCAAYGLLVLDQIVRDFDNLSSGEIFSYHELLIESAQYCQITLYKESPNFQNKKWMSEIGSIGAQRRHTATNRLKEWAIQEAAAMQGSDKSISQQLVKRIPPNLADASKDPERLIYETLRSRRV